MRKERERRNKGLRVGFSFQQSLCGAACGTHQHLQGAEITAGLTPVRLQAGNLGECGLRKAGVSLSSFPIIIWCFLGSHLP